MFVKSATPEPPVGGLPDRGFALVATLMLLVMMLVLGIGLLEMASIGLRQSGLELARAEARANARLAMMLALGELQCHAGPDTRVTATADIAGTSDGLRLEAGAEPGNGLSVSGNPKGLVAPVAETRHWTGVWRDADDADRIFDKTPDVERLAWLVSGRDPSPDDPAMALGPDGNPAHPDKAAKLAGGDGPVTAPWIDLTSGGRCAWWVGDEGVKARVDLTSAVPPGEAADEHAMASPRRGWQVVDGLEGYPKAGEAGEPQLTNIIRPGSLRLIDASLGHRNLLHVATAWSRGVLSDSLHGGLKGDLGPLAWENPPLTPGMEARIIPEKAAPGLKHLRWQALRDFARMRAGMRNGAFMTRNADEHSPPVAPVIDELRLLFGVRIAPSSGGRFRAQPCVKIALRLSNPYSVPLAWDRPLELEFLNATTPYRIPTRLYGAQDTPPILPRFTSEPALLNHAVFLVPPRTLPPGESEIYTQASTRERTIATAASRFEVPLSLYDAASGDDFRNCLIYKHPAPNNITGEWILHLQEDMGTSQMDLALRLHGELDELRRIGRIELNNFLHYHCAWKIPAGMLGRFKDPVPLQLYVLGTGLDGGTVPSAASLPGVDEPVVSALRSFADFNLRARRFSKPIICHQPPPYGMRMADEHRVFPSDPPGGLTGDAFTRGLDTAPARRVWLHPPEHLASLAQFQHADLTVDDDGISVGHQPGNAFANSYAPPFVHRGLVAQERTDFNILSFTDLQETRRSYYDISHLLNSALWDGWFFSTLPENGKGGPASKRMTAAGSTDETLPPAARWLMDGSFNVNSVNPEAWAALLAGLDGIRHPSESAPGAGAMLPRSPGQLGVADTTDGDVCESTLAGFRRLSPAQVNRLAEEIVRQVRLRGPFVSLSHFVNRALVPISESPELGRSGALQAAIDRSDINLRSEPGNFGLYDPPSGRIRLRAEDSGAPAADVPGTNATLWPDSPPDGIWPKSSLDANPGSLAGIYADRKMLTDDSLKSEQGHRCTGMPGWLTQADVLQVTGPSLSARSDTFLIRACGESSRKSGGAPVRVRCEAVVQRMPSHVDKTDPPEALPADLSAVNRRFGRRFRIVCFRWLAENEI